MRRGPRGVGSGAIPSRRPHGARPSLHPDGLGSVSGAIPSGTSTLPRRSVSVVRRLPRTRCPINPGWYSSRLLAESVGRLPPGGFASPTRHSTADARRGHRSDLAIFLSLSARERFLYPLPIKLLTMVTMPALSTSGRSGHASTTAARPGLVRQVSVGKWWARDCAEGRKSLSDSVVALRIGRFANTS